jgi:hypothetical protein
MKDKAKGTWLQTWTSLILGLVIVLVLASCDIISPPVPGEDWRTWRAYSKDYVIDDDLTVVFAALDEKNGYAVYDTANGERIASLLFPDGQSYEDVDYNNFRVLDCDNDGNNDIGIVVEDRTVFWYNYLPDLLGTWPEDVEGCFHYHSTSEE